MNPPFSPGSLDMLSLVAVMLLAADASSNRAPVWTTENWPSDREGLTIAAGAQYSLALSAHDTDGDEVTFAIEEAPLGAQIVAAIDPYPAEFRWTPSQAQIGKVFEIHLVAKDQIHATPRALRLRVEENSYAERQEADKDWESFMMPGVGGTLAFPANQGAWGVVGGPMFQVLIAGWIHSNDDYGPSHVRLFVDFAVVGSTTPGLSLGMLTNVGADLSIERNPGRRFLVPFYGIQVGAMIHRALDGGVVALVTPNIGVHLFSKRNMFLSTSLGYQMPLSGRYFDELRGIKLGLSFNFSMW